MAAEGRAAVVHEPNGHGRHPDGQVGRAENQRAIRRDRRLLREQIGAVGCDEEHHRLTGLVRRSGADVGCPARDGRRALVDRDRFIWSGRKARLLINRLDRDGKELRVGNRRAAVSITGAIIPLNGDRSRAHSVIRQGVGKRPRRVDGRLDGEQGGVVGGNDEGHGSGHPLVVIPGEDVGHEVRDGLRRGIFQNGDVRSEGETRRNRLEFEGDPRPHWVR